VPRTVDANTTISEIWIEFANAERHSESVKRLSYQRVDHDSGGKLNDASPVKLSGTTMRIGTISQKATSAPNALSTMRRSEPRAARARTCEGFMFTASLPRR
jgi:hypothetical protein